jgi:hypothetical protein
MWAEGLLCGTTKRPYADAAIADAAFSRTLSGVFSVMQRIKPQRTFVGVDSSHLQNTSSFRSLRCEAIRVLQPRWMYA